MSSSENDLTQSLLAEIRTKDELIETYRKRVDGLIELMKIKDERLKLQEDHIENLKKVIKESMEQTDKVIEIAQRSIKLPK